MARIDFDTEPTAEELRDMIALPLTRGQVQMLSMALSMLVLADRDELRTDAFYARVKSLATLLRDFVPEQDRR